MERNELRPRELARPYAIHRGTMAGAPRVGECGPVDFHPLGLSERFALRDDGRAAVDDGAERVEGQRVDSHEIRGGRTRVSGVRASARRASP